MAFGRKKDEEAVEAVEVSEETSQIPVDAPRPDDDDGTEQGRA